MKKIKIKHCFIPALLILLLVSSSKSPAQFSAKFINNTRSDGGISYNFFVGNDNDDFTTSINGFGSGFILDMFTGRYSLDVVTLGFESINVSIG
ncbi:MAG: hypothetical protein JSV22_12455, partial [Bacteroidales bacterium]